jgi:hydroxypyruvate isomerase
MNNTPLFSRRAMLRNVGAGVATALAPTLACGAEPKDSSSSKLNGNIKQSVCRWCYGKIPLEELAGASAKMGFKSVELLSMDDYKKVKSLGVTCAMLSGPSLTDGISHPENHEKIVDILKRNIEFAADEKLPNVIVHAGNRKGMSDEEGLDNCAAAMKKIVGLAEEKKVTICMELLNSKVDHKDNMCDHTKWGAAVVKNVGSERFKLLYDIYHMQIMEGDVIRTIRENKDYIAHYHTGGVPGRHEIDDTQELNYPAIVKAILDTGYTGYLGQEFIPARDPLTSLEQALRICDV